MNCKCNWVEAILAIVIIISAYMAGAGTQWVIIIAAVLLLLHALLCKKCSMCEVEPAPTPRKKSK